jgi:uncharacterized protein (DUF1330 family)
MPQWPEGAIAMKMHYAVGLALLGGLLLGAVVVKGLHAEPKPPVYLIAEIDVTDLEGYKSQYLPLAQASLKQQGGRIVAAGEGQGIRTFESTPPKSRVVIAAWDSLEQIEGWLNSAKYKEDRKIGDKYATFRLFAIGGAAQ